MKEKTKVISTLLCGVYGRAEIHTSSIGKIQIQICLWRSRTKHWSLWEKPPSGWKKLSTNGSSIGRMERAGCGGVIRDEHGNWVAGFTRHVGATNSFAAELWGLMDGLMLCCSFNIPCLIVELE